MSRWNLEGRDRSTDALTIGNLQIEPLAMEARKSGGLWPDRLSQVRLQELRRVSAASLP